MRFKPGKVLRPVGRSIQAAAARQIRSARAPKRRRGGTGGSLARRVRSPSLLRVEPWGVVVRFHDVGDELSYFIHGRPGQPARPIDLSAPRQRARAVVSKAARKHFARRDRRGR